METTPATVAPSKLYRRGRCLRNQASLGLLLRHSACLPRAWPKERRIITTRHIIDRGMSIEGAAGSRTGVMGIRSVEAFTTIWGVGIATKAITPVALMV
jgi:hypothetical protein